MRLLEISAGTLLAAGLLGAALLPSGERPMGGYATSLAGRTRGQRHNAALAARAVDGRVIESGQVFSFNRAVGSWSPDRGYTLAPVSYSGELVADWGGGVCQTSTTVYNAALVAGLDVVERHRHTWAPRYCPAGRDAAVAQNGTDLRIRNPYPYPVRVRANAEGDALTVEIVGRGPAAAAEIVTGGVATVPPTALDQRTDRLPAGMRRIANRGRPGVRVATWRVWKSGPRAGRRELLSRDAYPAMNRITLVGTGS